jgi:hypothetical protein
VRNFPERTYAPRSSIGRRPPYVPRCAKLMTKSTQSGRRKKIPSTAQVGRISG